MCVCINRSPKPQKELDLSYIRKASYGSKSGFLKSILAESLYYYLDVAPDFFMYSDTRAVAKMTIFTFISSPFLLLEEQTDQ